MTDSQVTRSQIRRALAAGASGEDIERLLHTREQRERLMDVLGEEPEGAPDQPPSEGLTPEELEMPAPEGAEQHERVPDEQVEGPGPSERTEGLPEFAPRVLFGQPVEQSQRPGQSPHQRGWWETAGRALQTGWLDVRQRWAPLGDASDDEPLSFDEQREQIGDLPVDVAPGLTQRELDRRVEWAEREQYLSQYQGRITAELLGSMPAYALDPVTLATMPVGGAQMRMAMQARTAGEYMRRSARAGAEIGAAGFFPEIGVQMAQRGEVDGMTLAAATLAPVVLTPVAAAPSRALRSPDVPTLGMAAESPPVAGAVSPQQVGADLRDLPALPNPVRERLFGADRRDPVTGEVSTTARTPEQIRAEQLRRLDSELTAGYGGRTEGSTVAWARDLAAGVPAARQFAQDRVGFDPDAGPIREWVTAEAQRTARETEFSPRDRERIQRAVDSTERGAPSPEERALLSRAGLVDEEGALLPGVTRQQVRERGPNQVRRQAEGRLRRGYDQALQAARVQRERLRGLGLYDPERRAGVEALETARREVTSLHDRIAGLNRRDRFIDDNVDVPALLNAIDASRAETAPSLRQRFQERPSPADVDDAVDPRALLPDDPDMRDLLAQARAAGVTDEMLAGVRARVADVYEQIRLCGVRT